MELALLAGWHSCTVTSPASKSLFKCLLSKRHLMLRKTSSIKPVLYYMAMSHHHHRANTCCPPSRAQHQHIMLSKPIKSHSAGRIHPTLGRAQHELKAMLIKGKTQKGAIFGHIVAGSLGMMHSLETSTLEAGTVHAKVMVTPIIALEKAARLLSKTPGTLP